MPRGGARQGAGRKKGGSNKLTKQKIDALQRFNDKLDDAEKVVEAETFRLMRPEEILFLVSNGLPRPDGGEWTPMQLRAAEVLIPYSIAKPASVQIHHVQRSDSRQFTDEELERIANTGGSSQGAFAAAESPLFLDGLGLLGTGTGGDDPGETPSPADEGT